MNIITNPEVVEKFKRYPKPISKKLNFLRQLIIETASESITIDELTETLKWGEPSYLAKGGSTIRIDWKAKAPDQYAMYFKCTSKLVVTFKEVFEELFEFEKHRAIVFDLDDKVPEKKLKLCIHAALHYHKLKQQPNLGLK